MGVRVRQRIGKPGFWVVVSAQGKQRYKHFPTRTLALKYAAIVEERLATAPLTKSQDTLSSYFEAWLHAHAQLQLKPSTFAQYTTGYERYIKPLLGSRLLVSITRGDVRQLVATMAADEKSKATMKAYLAPLSAMFNRAIEDEVVLRNPCFRILPRARGAGQSKVGRALNVVDLNRLLVACRTWYPQHYTFVLTLARTGMRVGEVQALCWTEVDFATHCICVRRTFRSSRHRSAAGEDYSPKSGRYRDVPMSEELERELQKAFAIRNLQSTLVFPSIRGTAKDLPNFRKRAWQTILNHAGIGKLRLHDLRHTVGTLLLEAGVPIVQVQKILGHHSIKVTVDLYGHLESGRYRDAVNVLDSVLSGSCLTHQDDEKGAIVDSAEKPKRVDTAGSSGR
jgi:integrase